ncbi:MAG TPA: hypothetical protein VIG99_10060 [Myxococcaceae bacterium]
MQLVLRSVNDQFFDQIVFPVLEMGMVSSETALERLRPQLSDERTGMLVELLLERGSARGTALWNLEQDLWHETVHRLVFAEWEQVDGLWSVRSEEPGFAADWGLMLHLGMMVESPHYPYDDESQSRAIVQQLTTEPAFNLGLAAFFAGLWDPTPRFPAHEVISTVKDRGLYRAGEICVADWSYRSANAVALWTRQLSTKLGRMLRREETRLSMQIPDAKAVLDYWTGAERASPYLPVPYSGLGGNSHLWVERLGEITAQVRAAAAAGKGLTMILTRSTDSYEERYL